MLRHRTRLFLAALTLTCGLCSAQTDADRTGGAFMVDLRMGAPSAKTRSVTAPAAARSNAVRNCARYEWARKYRDELMNAVAPYMALSDEELWRLPTSQDMPRSSRIGLPDGIGCPKCGQDHFRSTGEAWRVDVLARPWKMQCANCGQWFPSNDFASYYQSALDAQGKFRLDRGDVRFLQPEAGGNPDWVDDGRGVRSGKERWFFAAGYAFQRWLALLDVVEKMAQVYTLTDNPAYAHKAAVLLDRMADLYPEMTYRPHYRLGMEASTGGSGLGRVQGMIWECLTARTLSEAYDRIYDALKEDAALAQFAAGMSERYGTGDKSSAAAVMAHIENALLKEFVIGILDGRISGNAGLTEHAMAMTAVALDHPEITPRCLDWIFDPRGGKAPLILHELMAREGLSHEAAIGYSSIPGRSFGAVAEVLRQYGAYRKHDLYRDFPKFRQSFTMFEKLRMADKLYPSIGDGGGTMMVMMRGWMLPVEMALAGYRVYGDATIAREAWFSNGMTWDNLRLDVYAAEPEAVLESIRRDLAGPPPPFESVNLGGHGLAKLQSPGRTNPRSLVLYYGRMAGHGHADRLSLQVFAQDAVVIPDLGYPLYTGPHPARIGWVSHVVSHNTCMVNDKNPSRASWSGKTRLFEDIGFLRVADVDGDPAIYDGVKTYRRCVVMVDVDDENSYVLDVFWVRGGKNHRLIQNGGGPVVTHSGLELTAQEKGSYAGEEVDYGKFYDGPANWDYDGSGFMYLKNVSRATPSDPFWVDWAIVETHRTMPESWSAHLRVHNLTPVDEAALCDGIPPQRGTAPPSLRYLLRTRFGEGRDTQFVSIIEPYGRAPFIASVRALRNDCTSENGVAAVEVLLADGRRDVVIVSENAATVDAGDVTLDGRIGFVRRRGDTLLRAAAVDGTRLRAAQATLPVPATLTGTLVGWDDSDPSRTLLTVDAALPADGLVGRHILFANSERSDASYRIVEVIPPHTLSIGAFSLVERFKDPKDYAKGFIYTIAPGDRFRIPRQMAVAQGGADF